MQEKSRKVLAVFGAVLLLALPACSQKEAASLSVSETATAESASACSGTVSAVSADSITVTTEDGAAVTIPLTSETVFERGGMAPDGTAPGGQPPETPAGAESATGDSQPPAAPEGEPPANEGGASDGNAQPPEKPGEGQSAAGGQTAPAEGETPPEKPEGDAQPGGQPETLSYESVQVGDEVTITLAADGSAATVTLPGGGMGGPGGASQPDSYASANTYTEDTTIADETLSSAGTDENTVYLGTAGATVTLDGTAIDRTSSGSTGGDASSFYGVGAAALVTDGTLNVIDSTITTDAKGGAGVFAYGDGTAYVANSSITTQQDTSGGRPCGRWRYPLRLGPVCGNKRRIFGGHSL